MKYFRGSSESVYSSSGTMEASMEAVEMEVSIECRGRGRDAARQGYREDELKLGLRAGVLSFHARRP